MYASLISQLAAKARSVVRDIDPQVIFVTGTHIRERFDILEDSFQET